ncbi:MAG: hypothetical protein DWC05_03320 [Candidatus Poseidoniales archaeon]|nr:MAG: hypothetical protein DWC05_03320 [Candidatus Poseidoniales archaeon]
MHPRYGRRLPLTALQDLRLAHASYLLPSAAIVLAMLIHGANEPRAIPFFISEADHPGLQDGVFTIGLTVSGLVQMAYAWQLYHSLEVERPRLWFAATLTGMVAATNTVLVSVFDMYDFINPHILTAMLAFGGGVLWAFLASRALGSMATDEGRRLRQAGFAMAAIGFLVMVVAFESATNTIDPTGLTTAEFLNQAQDGIRIAAPAEYVLVAGLMICLASFRFELLAKESEPQTNLRDNDEMDASNP